MRDRSKSTMEDDSISSANGSVTGEPEISHEKEAANGAESNAESEDIFPTKKATDDKENKDGDSESSETPAKAARASKSKAKKESKPKKEKVKELPKRKSGRPTKKVQLESKNEESDEEEYEVEKILNSKKIRGKRHFLIKWKGFGASSNTWEPESTVSCPELISEYEERTDKTVEDDSEEEEAEKKSTPSKLKRGRPGSSKKGSPAKKAKATAKKGRSRPKKEFDYENADEDAEYDVEKILEVHTKKNGKREFLIHWKGWSTKHDSWEPEEHLYCEDLIKKFLAKVAQARSVEPKELRVAPETTRRFTLSQRSAGRRLSKRANHKQRVRYDDTE